MAGGYDGNSYPVNDLDSTLKLVNDESFEMGAKVSCAVIQDVHSSKHDTYHLLLASLYIKVTLYGWIG